MPQPRRPSREAEQPSATPAAAAAAPVVPAVVAATGAAAGGPLGGAVISLGAAALVKRLIDSFADFAKSRGDDVLLWVEDSAREQYPQTATAVLRAALDIERGYEAEFRRKALARLRRDLPAAAAISDPAARQEALRSILEREGRYLDMREEAMLSRVLNEIERSQVRALSPEGAYWKLSPYVKEHTLDCLAMAEKFWPWAVLDRIHPPLHPGCPCELLTLDDAVTRGLMGRDQIPNTRDAVRLAKRLMDDAAKAMAEGVTNEIVGEYLLALEEATARGAAEHGARVARKLLRWRKGFERGGEFRPQRGGSPGAKTGLTQRGLDRLHALVPDLPVPLTQSKRGRWTWIRGTYTFIPEAREWRKRVGGSLYTSPPGSTNVYRNGALVDEPGKPRLPEARKPPKPPQREASVEAEIEKRKAVRRSRYATRAAASVKSLNAAKPPIEIGDPAAAVMALRDTGFEIVDADPDGARMEFVHRGTDARLTVVFDGESVTSVTWTPDPQPTTRRVAADGVPTDWDSFRRDSLAWADELGKRFDARVQARDITEGTHMGDHAGSHEWSGVIRVGSDVRPDIERAGRKREAGESLTDDECRGVWSSNWVVGHEVAHSVNPISPQDFVDASNANLEEALAEECGIRLAVDRLRAQGQLDVLRWRQTHPAALSVAGVYREHRRSLGVLLSQAGLNDMDKRADFVFELKFNTPPGERLDKIAKLIADHDKSHTLDEWRDHVHLAMYHGEAQGGATLPFYPSSPGDKGGFDSWLSKLGFHLGDATSKLPHPFHHDKATIPVYVGGQGDEPDVQGPVPIYDHVRLRLGGIAGGSNGARWGFDSDGRRWLIKQYHGNTDQVATEALANAIYRTMGAAAAEAGIMHIDGRAALAYPVLDGKERKRIFHTEGPNEEVGRHFMVDALVANWDVAGLEDDNIMWDDQGHPFRVDQGGTFEMRAHGQPKPYGPVPVEVWGMMRKGQGKRSSKVDEDGMRQQGRDIAATLTPEKVDELVDAVPFDDEEMRERIRENLNARIAWMGRFGTGDENLPEPLSGDAARSELRDAQWKMWMRPEQYDALATLLDDPAVQEHLRSGKKKEQGTKEINAAIRDMDSLLRATSTPDEIYAFAGLRGADPSLVGLTLSDKRFLALTLNEQDTSTDPAVLRVLLPAKSRALFVRGVPDFKNEDSDPDLLLPRNAKMRVTGVRVVDGKRYVDATLLPPPEPTYPPYTPVGPYRAQGWHPAPTGPQPSSWLPKPKQTPGVNPRGGILVIVDGHVVPFSTWEQAADHVADSMGHKVVVKVRPSDSSMQERDITADEQAYLVSLATERVLARAPRSPGTGGRPAVPEPPRSPGTSKSPDTDELLWAEIDRAAEADELWDWPDSPKDLAEREVVPGEPLGDPFWGAGGCDAVAIAFKQIYPNMKIAALWYDDHGRRGLAHAVAYDPETGNAYDSYGVHHGSPADPTAGADDALDAYSDYTDLEREYDVDAATLAEHMDRRGWSPENDWGNDTIFDASHFIRRAFGRYTGEGDPPPRPPHSPGIVPRRKAEGGLVRDATRPDFTTIPDVNVNEPPLPTQGRVSTGMVVVEPDGRVWIYEPKGHFGGYERTFPKGVVEGGLTGQQNAHRELYEETGLRARVTRFLGDYGGDTGVTRYYVAERTGGEPLPDDPTPYVPGSGRDAASVQLVTPQEAGELLNRDRDQMVLADATGTPRATPPLAPASPGTATPEDEMFASIRDSDHFGVSFAGVYTADWMAERGYSEDAISRIESWRNDWDHGGGTPRQEEARQQMLAALRGEDTSEAARLLRERMSLETRLAQAFLDSRAARREQIEADYRKELADLQDEATGYGGVTKPLADWSVQARREDIEHRRQVRLDWADENVSVYRRGEPQDISAWTTDPEGANTSPLTANRRIEPDRSMTLKDALDDYYLLGGIASQWGAPGENEITLVKKSAVPEPPASPGTTGTNWFGQPVHESGVQREGFPPTPTMLLVTTTHDDMLTFADAALGRLLVPENFPDADLTEQAGVPFACDNGGFWGVPEDKYRAMCERMHELGAHPLWVTVPDVLLHSWLVDGEQVWATSAAEAAEMRGVPVERVTLDADTPPVGDWKRTAERFEPWWRYLDSLDLPAALVAQDGLETPEGLAWLDGQWDKIAAVFIGGSDDFKLGPGAARIAQLAHEHGKLVHVGRVNSAERIAYARDILHADTVDGSSWALFKAKRKNDDPNEPTKIEKGTDFASRADAPPRESGREWIAAAWRALVTGTAWPRPPAPPAPLWPSGFFPEPVTEAADTPVVYFQSVSDALYAVGLSDYWHLRVQPGAPGFSVACTDEQQPRWLVAMLGLDEPQLDGLTASWPDVLIADDDDAPDAIEEARWDPRLHPRDLLGRWRSVAFSRADAQRASAAHPHLPPIPHFYTPDKDALHENIARAKEMLDLAGKGDLEGVKKVPVHPKAKRLAEYQEQLVAILSGEKKTPETSHPAPPEPQKDEFEMAVEVKDAEAALGKFGIKVQDEPANARRITTEKWVKMLGEINAEAESLNKRWPGITNGVVIDRQMPDPGQNGVFDTQSFRIRIRPHVIDDAGYKNEYGRPWGISGDVRGCFRHEFGHWLDYSSKARCRDALKQTVFHDEDGNAINTAKWAKIHVSEYAGTMTSESIAEMFAMYGDPHYDHSLPDRVEQIIEALATGGDLPEPEIAEIPGGHIL